MPTNPEFPVSLLRLLAAAVIGGLVLCVSLPAEAGVVAQINPSSQRMRVFVDGMLAHDWPVSTAKPGYVTPRGSFRVGMMAANGYSHKYRSPMPYAMFFRGSYAIHGTTHVGSLGRPASHGCVRLAPGNARMLFRLAQARGGARVVIQD